MNIMENPSGKIITEEFTSSTKNGWWYPQSETNKSRSS